VQTVETLRPSDEGVVARYLQIRSLFHDGLLGRLERLIPQRYQAALIRQSASTLVAQVRGGFARPNGCEIWPVVFLTPVEVRIALCLQITSEELGRLGTVLNGPYRIRQRNWEDWWGWEKPLSEVPDFFDAPGDQQQELLVGWCLECLEWLANNGLLQRAVRS
jgi:hypothetical protein